MSNFGRVAIVTALLVVFAIVASCQRDEALDFCLKNNTTAECGALYE